VAFFVEGWDLGDFFWGEGAEKLFFWQLFDGGKAGFRFFFGFLQLKSMSWADLL